MFRTPVREMAEEDLRFLWEQHWPEDSELEFKSFLTADGKGEGIWNADLSQVRKEARDNIATELIGFANAEGGWLIIGISEDGSERPRHAAGLVPHQRCRDLLDRLRMCFRGSIRSMSESPVASGRT